MSDDDREREDHLAEEKEAAKLVLLALLTEEERVTRRHNGSAEAHTFEDSARKIAQNGDQRAEKVHQALNSYTDMVNALWIYSLAHKMDERIANEWLRSRRRSPAHMDVNSAIAEAQFHLRTAIVKFKPHVGSLYHYAKTVVFRQLDLWRARESMPVELPEKEARRSTGFGREPMDAVEDQGVDSGYHEEDMP